MTRLLLRVILCCVCFALGSSAAVFAARPSESLLPATTKGFLSITNSDQLQKNWDKTEWGQLAADPVMQPFVDDFRAQLKKGGAHRLERLGLTMEDLSGIPGGETAVALITPAPGRAAVAVIINVTGHRDEAAALLEKIAANLHKQGAKATRGADAALTVYDLPKLDGEKRARQSAYFLKDDVLAASDDAAVLSTIFASLKTPAKDNLAGVVAFSHVMQRCQADANDVVPDVRWFIEPFGYAEAARILNPPHDKRKGPDKLKIFRDQGFAAVQGLGGYFNFALPGYELVHRTSIYAPPVKGHENDKKKYTLAANMLVFPNGGDLTPQAWVPYDVATYASFNIDVLNAFDSSETLVDALVDEPGVFKDIIASLKEDKAGPQIDIRKELVTKLGNRVTILADNQLPITTKSERTVFAIEVTDADAVTAALFKLMHNDPGVLKHEIHDHVIWEVIEQEASVPQVKIENAGFAPVPEEDKQPAAEKEQRFLKNSAVTVAHGQLFVASHVEFLKKIVEQPEQPRKLTSSVEYQLVTESAKQLGDRPTSFRIFTRTDEAYRPTYELIRQAKMPQSETLLGKLLNAVWGEQKEGVLRPQKIDGTKLPDFEVARRYFGPAGTTISSEKDGWFIVGFNLPKQLQSSTIAPLTAEGPKPGKE